jgi:hypothetical protein
MTKSGKGQHFHRAVMQAHASLFARGAHEPTWAGGTRAGGARVYGSQQKPLVLTVNPEGALCGLCTRGDLIRQADSAHIDSS